MLKFTLPVVLALILCATSFPPAYADCDDESCAVVTSAGCYDDVTKTANNYQLISCSVHCDPPPSHNPDYYCTEVAIPTIMSSCSGPIHQQPGQKLEVHERPIDLNSPEERKLRDEVILAGNFQDQLSYFSSHYGRVPASYEEWRDSGFLLFTPWSGHPTQATTHVDHQLSVENDAYGTFNYKCLGPNTYELEFVFSIRDTMKVLYFSNNMGNPVRKGLTYMEAKADAYFALLELLWIYNMEFPNENPGSLSDAVNGYISLVPEGFRVPEGVEASGSFEYGFDYSTGNEYIISDLARSQFSEIKSPFLTRADWESKDELISDDKLVLFSSDLLKAGYPGLFDQ